MEARTIRWALCACLPIFLGASYRTQNFIVNAPTQAVAKQVGDSAERFRSEIAVEWLGEELPSWGQPCPITVQVGDKLGAGGATSFVFDRGEVFGWQMTIQGSLERILDSVLPHEVTHTIFATHFRQPLPRWADEGACTTVEHSSERTKQQQMLIQFLKTGRGISFSSMFAMKEYPADVLPLYAQGHSLASYFIAQGGKRKFLQFVADGLQDENWVRTVNAHYGFADLRTLQTTWLDWVRTGSPPLQQTSVAASVATSQPALVAQANIIPTAPAPANLVTSAPAAPPAPMFQWTSTAASNRKRERPTPNLVHQVAPSSGIALANDTDAIQQAAKQPAAPLNSAVVSAGHMVPVTPSSGIVNAMATVPSGPIQGGASRPQSPETPKQIVLQWAKGAEQPVSAYSSGAQPQSVPAAAPLFDAGLSSGVMRR
ncbi:MAG: hypothetical protein K8U03_01490 [Planctomycetia bacterium]|nr:hypothetical protein [Planctomycetia bacterium]